MKAALAFARRYAVWLLAFALLFPTLAYPPGRDTATYLVIGRSIRQGGLPYLDAFDIKPPAFLLLYSLPAGASDDLLSAWFRLRAVDVLVNVLCAACIARVASRLMGHLAALPAAVWYLALYTYQGPGVFGQTEVWANLFVFAGLLVLLEPPRWSRPIRFAVLGLLAGAAAALKPSCSFPLIAGILAFPLVHPLPDRQYQKYLVPTAALLASFIFINVLPWLWLSARGGFPAFLDVYEGFLKGHLREGNAAFGDKCLFYLQAFAFQFVTYWPLLLWLIPGLVERQLWNRRTLAWVFLMWLAGFAGMWFQGRAMNYHFQVLSASTTLLGTASTCGLANRLLRNRPYWQVVFVAALPALLFQICNNHGRDRAALLWLAGKIPAEEYAPAFSTPAGDSAPADTVRAAMLIRQRTQRDDRVLVWVNESENYIWADRMPSNRFVYAAGIVSRRCPDRWKVEYTKSLSENPPSCFLVVHGDDNQWMDAPPGDSASFLEQWPEMREVVRTNLSETKKLGHLDLHFVSR